VAHTTCGRNWPFQRDYAHTSWSLDRDLLSFDCLLRCVVSNYTKFSKFTRSEVSWQHVIGICRLRGALSIFAISRSLRVAFRVAPFLIKVHVIECMLTTHNTAGDRCFSTGVYNHACCNRHCWLICTRTSAGTMFLYGTPWMHYIIIFVVLIVNLPEKLDATNKTAKSCKNDKNTIYIIEVATSCLHAVSRMF